MSPHPGAVVVHEPGDEGLRLAVAPDRRVVLSLAKSAGSPSTEKGATGDEGGG
ncbi:hypothetical protein [Methanoculleus sp. UBA303]|uniref:hypothetical protein n=1 Tax=Methanoculleus sp. UBA303 TaxID=1915497 RepID=UPI0025D1BB80|nr:hypothetical protein [Methanoculleus sp. UBA303]